MFKMHGFKYFLCLSVSISLSLFFSPCSGREPELTWTKEAALEAEAVASISCSGHGVAFIDGPIGSDGKPICECHSCYGGPDCSKFSPECPADANRWALIKDEDVYQRMNRYSQLSTLGVSRDTQFRAFRLLKSVLKDGGRDFFEFGHNTMSDRWRRLNNILSKSKRFSLQKLAPHYCSFFKKITDPSPAYGWLRCERKEEKDCYNVLRAAGIISRRGSLFGAEDRYVRLSLIKHPDDFDWLLQRLKALVAKKSAKTT